MKDKNEFRHLKQNDLKVSVTNDTSLEHQPWYRDLYESIRNDIDALLSLIDGREKKVNDE